MFIQTEDTPNPSAMKFLPGRAVLVEGARPVDMPSREEAEISPLASALFNIAGVTGVLLGHDFITVTKDQKQSWEVLRPQLLALIMNHMMANAPVLTGEALSGDKTGGGSADEEAIIAQINEILEARVRPVLAQDGGDVSFQGFKDGVVFLRLKGSCAGCPSSTMTLKHGIENLLKHYVPEVLEVRQVR